MNKPRHAGLLSAELVKPALRDSFVKLNPRLQWRNPVMFVVWIGALLITGLWLQALFGTGEAPAWFIGANALWLWFTVLFANFAEALAEGRSKAQAASLRGLKKRGIAKKRVQRIGEDGNATAMATHGPLFVVLLIATVLLVGALTYVPAIALGPVVEHLNLTTR